MGRPRLPDDSLNDLILKYDRPEVAALIARQLIAHNMDYEATCSSMLRKQAKAVGKKIEDADIIAQAREIERSPQIQQALQEHLAKIGLGEDAQSKLVALLWNAALDKRNDRRWPPAVQALIKLTGMDKSGKGDEPIDLPLAGLKKGITKMFDGKIPDTDAPADEPEFDDD